MASVFLCTFSSIGIVIVLLVVLNVNMVVGLKVGEAVICSNHTTANASQQHYHSVASYACPYSLLTSGTWQMLAEPNVTEAAGYSVCSKTYQGLWGPMKWHAGISH
jgi:hypothetical protein